MSSETSDNVSIELLSPLPPTDTTVEIPKERPLEYCTAVSTVDAQTSISSITALSKDDPTSTSHLKHPCYEILNGG